MSRVGSERVRVHVELEDGVVDACVGKVDVEGSHGDMKDGDECEEDVEGDDGCLE